MFDLQPRLCDCDNGGQHMGICIREIDPESLHGGSTLRVALGLLQRVHCRDNYLLDDDDASKEAAWQCKRN